MGISFMFYQQLFNKFGIGIILSLVIFGMNSIIDSFDSTKS